MTNTKTTKTAGTQPENERSSDQAKAQLDSIKEMVAALNKADENGSEDERDEARTAIQEDALSVEVRSGWYMPGAPSEEQTPTEYKILLCTGGPAVQIRGDLDEHNEPETARIEHQDWFTPWTEFPISGEDEQALLAYARCFYFGA